MENLVLMVSGKQGSGKSSLVTGLTKELQKRGVSSTEVSFAEPFYRIHNFARDMMKEYGFDVLPKDGDFLQYLGNEWGKKRFGEDVWVKIASRREQDFFKQSKLFPNVLIFSDTRFYIEVEAYPKAVKVRLECPEHIRKERVLATPGQHWRENTSHRSEVELDNYQKWDLTLHTNLISTEYAVDHVMDKIAKYLPAKKEPQNAT